MLRRPRRCRCSRTGWRHTCSAAATKLFDFELHFFFLVIISPPEQEGRQFLFNSFHCLVCIDTNNYSMCCNNLHTKKFWGTNNSIFNVYDDDDDDEWSAWPIAPTIASCKHRFFGSKIGEHAFSFARPHSWNSLTETVHSSDTPLWITDEHRYFRLKYSLFATLF